MASKQNARIVAQLCTTGSAGQKKTDVNSSKEIINSQTIAQKHLPMAFSPADESSVNIARVRH